MTGPVLVQYAGFGRRLAAHGVDILINLLVVVLGGLTLRVLRVIEIFQQPSDPAAAWDGLGVLPKSAIIIAFIVCMGALYVPLCHASPAQATVGKRMAKIYLTADEGGRLSFVRALWRWFLKVVSSMCWIDLVSVTTILVDPKRRALHDFMVGSVVALDTRPSRPNLEWWRIGVGIGVQVLLMVIAFLYAFDTTEF